MRQADEVRAGARFAFGRNWASFLATLDDGRIAEAERSLREMLEVDRLDGMRWLDIGSGSGLSSLAARRLGATVVSFDYDPDSVACTAELRRRYFPDDARWTVLTGSVLDEAFMQSLGRFDIVYSWGVLHHTGGMWTAVERALQRVVPGRTIWIALYNDEGATSRLWLKVKQLYCSGPLGRWAMSLVFIPYFAGRAVLKSIVTRRNAFAAYRGNRGMSIVHDWIDWLGGLPFEVAKPEEVVRFCRERGFTLWNLKTTRRLGCNEFVLRAPPPPPRDDKPIAHESPTPADNTP